MDEHSVIEKINSGDDQALALVYKFYRAEFISWLLKTYKCTTDEAKDIYQIAILIFYENVKNGKITKLKSSIKTYLFAIGKNKVMEEKRAKTKFIHQEERMFHLIHEPAEEGKEDMREYHVKTVEKCLQKLGDPCRSILEQYYYHKMSMRDITARLGYKNPDTLKNLKYKCMNRLKKLVEEESFHLNKLSNG